MSAFWPKADTTCALHISAFGVEAALADSSTCASSLQLTRAGKFWSVWLAQEAVGVQIHDSG